MKIREVVKTSGKAGLFSVGVTLVTLGASWLKETLFQQGVITIILGFGAILIGILWVVIQAEQAAVKAVTE